MSKEARLCCLGLMTPICFLAFHASVTFEALCGRLMVQHPCLVELLHTFHLGMSQQILKGIQGMLWTFQVLPFPLELGVLQPVAWAK